MTKISGQFVISGISGISGQLGALYSTHPPDPAALTNNTKITIEYLVT